MHVTQLVRDDQGVTPVVGIILLVAIAVILASVVAVFALGIGDQTGPSPTASFSFDHDTSGGTETLTITHDTGENIVAAEVYIRGDSDTSTSLDRPWDSSNWLGTGNTSATVSGQSAIASGDSLVMEVGPAYDVTVVWQSPEGDRSAMLADDQGPDA